MSFIIFTVDLFPNIVLSKQKQKKKNCFLAFGKDKETKNGIKKVGKQTRIIISSFF